MLLTYDGRLRTTQSSATTKNKNENQFATRIHSVYLRQSISMKNALRIKRKEERKRNFEKSIDCDRVLVWLLARYSECDVANFLYFSMGFNWSSLTTTHLRGPPVAEWTLKRSSS